MAFGKDLSDSIISIAGKTMESMDNFKCLAIKKLSFYKQIEKVCKKVSEFSGVLCRGRSCFS